MRLAFVDFIYHYDASRPDADQPLGGTTSAVCFLARAMVDAGIACTFFNRMEQPTQSHGIDVLPLARLTDFLGRDDFDAYIFCGRWGADWVGLVRAHTRAPLIAWMHESVFAPPFTPALAAFDAVVYVSAWQQRINQAAAHPKWQQVVIANAMNPAVAKLFPAGVSVLPAKTAPPLLLFVGSFARGAFHIAPLLDKIRAVRDDFVVEMYCNLDPSRHAQQDAAYITWLRAQSNIAHVGMVGQPQLAQRMRVASILLAPNPWPETSCIALIEALGAGMQAVTTNRAALPETAAGFAHQIAMDAPDDPIRFDMPVDYEAFAAQVVADLAARDTNPAVVEDRLRQQVDFFQAHYQWAQRVQPWLALIRSLTENHPVHTPARSF